MKKETIEKFGLLELQISKDKGEFSLFGLFLREDAPDKYDLLVSAPWLDVDKEQGLKYLADQVQSQLQSDELLSISRIVILEKGNPILKAINKTVHIKHGNMEIKDSNFNGVQIIHSCISTSVDPNANAKQ